MGELFSEIWRFLSSVRVPVFGGNFSFASYLLGLLAVSVSIIILIRYFKDF